MAAHCGLGARRARLFTAALAAALLATPGAAAALTLSIAGPADAVAPETAGAEVTATVTLDCANVLLLAGGAQVPAIELIFDADVPAEVFLSGSLNPRVEVAPCQSGPAGDLVIDHPFVVSLSNQARAFDEKEVTLTVDANGQGATATLAEFEPATAGFRVAADVYMSFSAATTEQGVVEMLDGKATFHVRLLNHGNAPVTVVAEPDTASRSPLEWFDGWDPVTVPSALEPGGGNVTAALSFHVPADAPRDVRYRFLFTPSSGETEGQPVALSFLMRNPDFKRETPGPGVLPLVLAVALAALALRRRL